MRFTSHTTLNIMVKTSILTQWLNAINIYLITYRSLERIRGIGNEFMPFYLRSSTVKPTPYSWILNQIRLGAEQVNLWVSARLRWPKVHPTELWKSFVAAWSGLAVGRGMMNEPDKPLEWWLNQSPIMDIQPGTPYAMNVWASYLGEHLVSPWDIKLIAKVTIGGYSDYSSFRYEAGPGTNYRMVQKVTEGLLVKEYLRDDDGYIELHAAYVIGTLQGSY